MRGLDSQPVPDKQEGLVAFVEDCKGKHSPQLVHTFRSVLLVEMDYDFRIGMGVKTMAERFKLPPQSGKVIDLSVKDHPDIPVFVVNRLASSGNINDAETPHPDSCRTVRIDTFVVRPAVHHGKAHAVNRFGVGPGAAITVYHSGNSTHSGFSSPHA